MIEDINLITSYLARRDVQVLSLEELHGPSDVLLLAGSCLMRPIELAAQALKDGVVEQILVSGGIGHSTQYLRNNVASHALYKSIKTEGRTEADIIRDILVEYMDVSSEKIVVENKSTNCGANAEYSKQMLDQLGINAKRILLIQDPTMQLRTHASCQRTWKGCDTKVLSYAPFIPSIHEQEGSFIVRGEGEGIWQFDRFLSLLVGEIVRLHDNENGYGPRGKNFIDHIDVPGEVLAAYERVAKLFKQSNRV